MEWPYDGPDEWIRLTILLGAPFLLGDRGHARVLPRAPRRARCCARRACVVLLLVYGVPVTEHDPGEPLLRGLVLLVLVAAWLWLPRLGTARGRRRCGASSRSIGAALAARGGRARRRQALVGLPRLELVRRRHADHVQLEPRVRPARLAARRDHAAQHPLRPAALLEGGDARRLRRPPLGPHAANDATSTAPSCRRSSARPGRPGTPRVQPALGRGDRGHGPLADQRADRGRGHDLRGRGGASHATAADGTTTACSAIRSRRATPTRCTRTRPTRARSQMRSSTEDGYGDDLRELHARSACRTRASRRHRGRRAAGRRGAHRGARAPRGRERPAPSEPLAGDAGAERAAQDSRYAERVRPRARLDGRARRRSYDAVKAIERRLQEDYTLRRAGADPAAAAGRLPVPGAARLLPAVLRRDGADAADGRDPGAGGGRLLARLLQPRHATSTACATWTRTPGSRSTSPASAGCRSTPRRPRRRPSRSRPGWPATSAASGDAGEVSNPRGGVAAERLRPAPAAQLDDDGGACWTASCRCCSSLALLCGGGLAAALGCASAPAARLTAEQLAEAQLAELRRALDRLDWEVPAATTLLGLEQPARPRWPGRPRRATPPGCGRTATTRAPRARRARASAARCAAS